MGYFIHNKYDKVSIQRLSTVDTEVNTVIDYYGLLESGNETYKYLDTSSMGRGVINSLNYVPVANLSSGEKSFNNESSKLEFASSIIIRSIQRHYVNTSGIFAIAPVDPNKCSVFVQKNGQISTVQLTANTIMVNAASTFVEIVEFR